MEQPHIVKSLSLELTFLIALISLILIILVVEGNLEIEGSSNGVFQTLKVLQKAVIGESTSSTLEVQAEIESDLIPETSDTHDLGSATKRWDKVYAKEFVGASVSAGVSSLTADPRGGISLSANTGAITIGISVIQGGGLSVSSEGLSVQLSKGLIYSNEGISVHLGSGLCFDASGGVSVKLGTGLIFDSNGGISVTTVASGSGDTISEADGICVTGSGSNKAVGISLSGGESGNNGLQFIDGGLSVQLSSGLTVNSEGISVRLGTGLCFDANGGISVTNVVSGSGDTISEADGICVTGSGSTKTVGISLSGGESGNNGLQFIDGGLSVQLSSGLTVNSEGISVRLGTGLCFDANGGISVTNVNIGTGDTISEADGICVTGSGSTKTVGISLSGGESGNNGLQFIDGGLSVQLSSGLTVNSEGISVRLGTGLCFDANGGISVNIGTGDTISETDGICVTGSGSTKTVGISLSGGESGNNGLQFIDGGLSVQLSSGLTVNSEGISVRLGTGLCFDANGGISVNIGTGDTISETDGICVTGSGSTKTVGISLSGGETGNNGLQFIDGGLSVQLSSGLTVNSEGISVRLGTGLCFDANGGISVNIGTGDTISETDGICVTGSGSTKTVGISLSGGETGNNGLQFIDGGLSVQLSSGLTVNSAGISVRLGTGLCFDANGGISVNIGTGDTISEADGICVTGSGSTKTVGISLSGGESGNNGLQFIDGGLSVQLSSGLTVNSAGISVRLGTGLCFDANGGISVTNVVSGSGDTISEADGICVTGSGSTKTVGISLSGGESGNNGLQFIDGGLSVQLSSGLTVNSAGISVRLGTGLCFDASGGLSVNIGTGDTISEADGICVTGSGSTKTVGISLSGGESGNNGLQFIDGGLSVQLSSGLTVNSAGISVRLGTGLCFDASGGLSVNIGTGDTISEADGICVTGSGSTKTVGISLSGGETGNNGLQFIDGGLSVQLSSGLTVNSAGISVRLGTGLCFDANGGISVNIGTGDTISEADGICVTGSGSTKTVGISLSGGESGNNGLQFIDGGLSVQLSSGLTVNSEGISVRLGTGLCFDANGGISVNIGTGDTISETDGICVTGSGSTKTVGISLSGGESGNNGLQFIDGGLSVQLSSGLTVNSEGISVRLGTGLCFDANGGISVNIGSGDTISETDGICVTGSGSTKTVGISLSGGETGNNGLQFIDGGLSVQLSSGLTVNSAGISVRLGTGLCFDANGGISVNIGTGDTISEADGICVTGSGSTKTVGISLSGGESGNNGLQFIDGGLSVQLSSGLTVNSEGISVRLGTGLCFDANGGISVNIGTGDTISETDGICVTGSGSTKTVGISLSGGETGNNGLQFIDGGLSVQLSSGLTVNSAGISVRLGTGLCFDANGGISVNIGTGDTISEADGICVTGSGSTKTVGISLSGGESGNNGLQFIDGGLSVQLSSGLTVNSAGISVRLGTGLCFDASGGLSVNIGTGDTISEADGICVTGSGSTKTVGISLSGGESGNNGLQFIDGGLSVQLSSGLTVNSAGVSVALGTGMSFDSDNQVIVSKPYGLASLGIESGDPSTHSVPGGSYVDLETLAFPHYERDIVWDTSYNGCSVQKPGMYFVNAYFGLCSVAHGGLSVSLMSYPPTATGTDQTKGTQEITTFSYNYDTVRLIGMVQAREAGRKYNIFNHGPSTLQISHLTEEGTCGNTNRFEIAYMGNFATLIPE